MYVCKYIMYTCIYKVTSLDGTEFGLALGQQVGMRVRMYVGKKVEGYVGVVVGAADGMYVERDCGIGAWVTLKDGLVEGMITGVELEEKVVMG